MNSKHFPIEPVRIKTVKPDWTVRMLEPMSTGIHAQYRKDYIRTIRCSGDDCLVCKYFD